MEPPNTKKMELRAIRNIKPEEEVAKQIENINAEEELTNRSEAGRIDHYEFLGDCQLYHGGVQVYLKKKLDTIL